MSILLQINGLKKSYKNPEGGFCEIVDVEKFTLEDNSPTALVGRSGSGKSTFLNLICGVLRADSGSIVVKGTDICTLSESKRDRFRARNIGYMFQTFNLLQNFTALENVLVGMKFAGRVDREAARQILVDTGLGDRLNYRPSQLSVGQQQRVALARALVNSPSLVIADEPTGNLDPVHAAEAMGLIKSLCSKNGAGLLLVSHDRELIADFDRVLDLSELNRAGGV
jgi:ABC-type lipoprotein export system ATPase subunit